MSKIPHLVVQPPVNPDLNQVIEKKLVSSYFEGNHVIIARVGVNKSTLRILLHKEIGDGSKAKK